MGTHPIFESDFDCLTEMFAGFGGKIVLGSTSPRRSTILKQLRIEFEVRPSNFDETNLMSRTDLKPRNLVEKIATEKANAVALKDEELLITADTVIALGDKIFGKPSDPEQQFARLKELNGKAHSVFTGVCIKYAGESETFSTETLVQFGEHSDEFLKWYVDSGDGSDKAGGYGTQSLGACLVKSVSGCYYNVMGLPVHSLIQRLNAIINK